MPRKHHNYTKVTGVRRLEQRLLELTIFVRQSELARYFGCNRSTIGRWIAELEQDGVILDRDEQNRVRINRDQYVTAIRLSRDESLMVMIALRLMQQHMQQSNIHGVEAMHKLGAALRQGIAPSAGEYILQQTRHQREMIGTGVDNGQRYLERIGEAWIKGQKLRWRYMPLHSRSAFDEIFHPYLIEPIAIGMATYVVGYSETAQAIRVRKLDRIDRIPIILEETFDIDPGFDPSVLFKGAWGIWFAPNEQPVPIKLRFSRSVARRVAETRWHPSEAVQEDDRGNLIWTAVVDEWKPVVAWIRGWGADCEVLEPAELRAEVVANARRSAVMYNVFAAAGAAPDEDLLRDIFGG